MGGAHRVVSSRAASAPRDDVSGARGRRAGLRARAALVPPAQRLAPRRSAMRVQLERCCGEWRELDEEFRQLQVRRGPGAAHRAPPAGVPNPAGEGAMRGRSAASSGVPRPSEGRRLLSWRSGVEGGETAMFAPGPRPPAGGAAAEEEGNPRSPSRSRPVAQPALCSLSPRRSPAALRTSSWLRQLRQGAAGWRPGSKREHGAPEPQRAQLRAPVVIPAAVSRPASRALRSVSLDIRTAGSGRGHLRSLAAERGCALPSVCGTLALGCATGEVWAAA